MKNFIKISFFIIAILLLTFLIRCNKNTINGTNCIECLPTEPDSALINIKVTLNNENPVVPLIVYQGRYNPNRMPPVFIMDTANIQTTSNVSIYVPTNHFYSVRAEYKSGDKIIYAVDGGDMDSQQQGACDNICWQVIGGNYDVQLK